jgi:hypothetical protein
VNRLGTELRLLPDEPSTSTAPPTPLSGGGEGHVSASLAVRAGSYSSLSLSLSLCISCTRFLPERGPGGRSTNADASFAYLLQLRPVPPPPPPPPDPAVAARRSLRAAVGELAALVPEALAALHSQAVAAPASSSRREIACQRSAFSFSHPPAMMSP